MNINNLYIINKLPTPYSDDLYRALHLDPAIKLQVFHLWKGSARRPWKSVLGLGYPNYYMRVKLGIDWLTLKTALKDRKSLFMVGDWAHLPCVLVILARILVQAPVACYADTPQEHLYRPFFKRILRGLFLRWLLTNVNFVLGTGRPARRALIGMGAHDSRVVDFQLTVDQKAPLTLVQDDEFIERCKSVRAKLGCSTRDKILIGMAGTIDFEKKAQHIGLKAFAAVAKDKRNDLGLLVAGAGEQLDSLKRLAHDLGIDDRVFFMGWQEPDGMNVFFHSIDIFLHPAHYDPFPVVVLEALNWSRPVVGTITSGSVEEKIVDGVNGFQVRAGNELAMATALERIISERHLLEKRKLAARRKIEEWPIQRAVDVLKFQMAKL